TTPSWEGRKHHRMESMLSKLRSTVSNVASRAASDAVGFASQVSNYLPGNPVTREYEVTAHIASAGPGLYWKIYKGYKKSTKQDAAIFVFEKRLLDKWDKQEREQMIEKLRKGVSQLTRIRHPQVLTVQHPLEESRETLAFATEPVLASLANILGSTENMPQQIPSVLKDYKLFDVEIKYGLVQVSEGLAFLHNSVKSVHRNICPENIVVNHEGTWKLFGFDYVVANSSPADQPPFWSFEEYDSKKQPTSQPNLNYLAPEYALTHSLDAAADLYPLGVLIYAIFNEGRPLFNNHDDFSVFKKNCCELKNPSSLKINSIPEGLRDQVRLLLNATPQLRPDALQLTKIPYFDDVGVKTLNYLDQMFQWDNMQKSQFYKSLPTILPQMPHRIAVYRIVPSMVKECINPTMIPFVLPVILQVAERATKEEFIQHILPYLKPIMKITDPVQVMLLLMQKMELLLGKTPPEDVKSDVLPMLYRSLECDTQQIQELCLSIIPSCAQLVEHSAMKNALLPRIKKLCLGTSYLSVRVNCLVCVGKILEHLDKWLVMDDVFPFMQSVPSREAPVVMAIVGIFKVALTHKKLGISKEILANKVLPFLFPLSIENSLSPTQHSSIMTLIKDMIERVESEHSIKLEQLNSIKDEQKALQKAMPSTTPNNDNPSISSNGSNNSFLNPNPDLEKVFTGLGMDNKPSTISNNTTAVMKASTPSPTASTLSLQDKQRMATQATVGENLRKQPPLLPSPPPPANSIIKSPTSNTKNLTGTLITNNMNSMTNGNGAPSPGLAMTNNVMNMNMLNTSMNSMSGTGFPVQMSTPSIMGGGMMQQTQNLGGMSSPMGSISTMNSMNTINSMSNMNSMNAINTMNTLRSPVPQKAQNLSAFDSLLPQQSRAPSMIQMGTSMTSPGMSNMSIRMMSPMQPMNTMIGTGNTPGQQPFKPLSSSDISDFLGL
ncbi:unnamed protein product, partial [Meganyctiphanes norvegica]